MRQNDAIVIIMMILPLVILLWRRCFFTYLLSVLLVWAIWVLESWDPSADNNLGAATIGVGWVPVALYCGFCYAMTGLLCRVRRRVTRAGRNGRTEADERTCG